MNTQRNFDEWWERSRLSNVDGSVLPTDTITARSLAVGAALMSTLGDDADPLGMASLPLFSVALESDALTTTSKMPDFVQRSVLGEGGMGRVVLARQSSLRREVALKTPLKGAEDPLVIEALLREAVVMGSLEHRCIIPVHGLGRDSDGAPVLVMKYIDGISLHNLLEDFQHPAWARWTETTDDRRVAALLVLMEVCSAVEFAHQHGIIHRDVKPENVLLTANGEVYLSDWGVAAHLHEPLRAEVRGTPAFMAPELVLGATEQLSVRTDVYLLGATLHFILTGTCKHTGPTLYAVFFSALSSVPVIYPENVPPDLAALCNEATHGDPSERPVSAAAFRRRIVEHLRHRGSITSAAEGTARLNTLRAMISDPHAEPSALQRVAVECRYAFEQSLREWSDNSIAKDGREACLNALFAYELQRENLDAASTLAHELSATAEMRSSLDTLRRDLERRREHATFGLRETLERDVSVGARQRGLMIGTLLLLGSLTVAVESTRRGSTRVIVVTMLLMVPVLSAVLVALIAWRRRGTLLATRVNRQLVGMISVSLAALITHRAAFLLLQSGASEEHLLGEDLYMLGTIGLMGAVTIRHELVVAGLSMLLGHIACMVWPSHAQVIFFATTVLGSAASFLAIGRYKVAFFERHKPHLPDRDEKPQPVG
jgi:eukaryotic-like serine/threonine-protein kinase